MVHLTVVSPLLLPIVTLTCGIDAFMPLPLTPTRNVYHRVLPPAYLTKNSATSMPHLKPKSLLFSTDKPVDDNNRRITDSNHDGRKPVFFPAFSSLVKENKGMFVVVASALTFATALCSVPLSSYATTAADLTNSASANIDAASTILQQFTSTGFYQAFSLVFISEIGDKTFFIAGLLAMKTSRLISFLGSIGALAAMTVISCVIGQIFHAVPAGLAQGIPLDDVAAVLAFTFFGLKTLKEAIDLDPSEGNTGMDEEFAEAEETVEESSDIITKENLVEKLASIFVLVFAAEFGDRSFLSTIALSASQNPFSVCGGAVAAHALATGIAVVGGGVMAKYISEKVIGYIGGTLFLVFALTTALGIF